MVQQDVRKLALPITVVVVMILTICGGVWSAATWTAKISVSLDANTDAIHALAKTQAEAIGAVRDELKYVWTKKEHEQFVQLLQAMNPGVKLNLPVNGASATSVDPKSDHK
jgi:hypothetical protein